MRFLSVSCFIVKTRNFINLFKNFYQKKDIFENFKSEVLQIITL